jgi:two-component system chemotaxis sensor kinase CheA
MLPPNAINTFLQEAEDLLAQIEEIVVDLNPQDASSDDVNTLFRAFHTIKGSGAMFGFTAVADFTHHLETTLDLVRDGGLGMSQQLLDLILAAKDHIKALLDAAGTEAEIPRDSEARIITMLAALSSTGAAVRDSTASEASPKNAAQKSDRELQTWKILFRPAADLMRSGMSPVPLLNELRRLGECHVTGYTGAIPTLDLIQAEDCYLWWDIELTTASDLDAIKDVFIFVEDGSEIRIDREESRQDSRRSESSAEETHMEAPASQQVGGARDQGGRIPISGAAKKNSHKDSTVRVPAEKLDLLVNLVGELVMNQSRLTQAASRLDAPELAEPVEEIERLVAELRDNVLGIRMMPIGTTFTRFKRLVHDLSAELGKEIDLVTEGAETELDKTVLDQLADPLVHLIRNSIDHGIEPIDERLRSEKPRRGEVRLSAIHTGSNVVVSIRDDGRGLDRNRILTKAASKRLVQPDASLSDKEIFNLIFLPGFSTAEQVTNVSGRGVGMDVVKRKIEALRGSISIESELQKGTTISLTLPLTLAIIDGLLVEVGSNRFIVPMSLVAENVELHRSERLRKNGRNVVTVRGELIPYIHLRETFGTHTNQAEIEKVVIVQHQDQRVGLVVDRVLGSHQTVIQSLGSFYGNVDLFSGATIMGDGRVALILDLAGLIRFVDRPDREILLAS